LNHEGPSSGYSLPHICGDRKYTIYSTNRNFNLLDQTVVGAQNRKSSQISAIPAKKPVCHKYNAVKKVRGTKFISTAIICILSQEFPESNLKGENEAKI